MTIEAAHTQQPSITPRAKEILDRTEGRTLHLGAVGHDSRHDPKQIWLHGLLEAPAESLVGVDVDEHGVSVLQAEGYDVHVDDATTLDAVDGPFDTVVAGEVIEHLDAPGELFAAVKRVLAPGGRLLITTPNPWALVYYRRAISGDPVGNDEHTCWLDESTLTELARRHGFDGEIRYLQPSKAGLSSLAYRAGKHRLGGTRLFGEFRLTDNDQKSEENE